MAAEKIIMGTAPIRAQNNGDGTFTPLFGFDPAQAAAEDSDLEIARGLVTGITSKHRLGGHAAVTTAVVNIAPGGIMWFPTVASTVRVKALGNAADDTAGTGARTILLTGLDENLNVATDTLVTAGVAVSVASTITFLRLLKAEVILAGSGRTNDSLITLEVGAGGTDVGIIDATKGLMESSHYCVPAGFTAYVTRLEILTSGTKMATVTLYRQGGADESAAPFSARRVMHGVSDFTGQDDERFRSYIILPEKTDVWATGVYASGTAGIEVDLDFILVDNTV